MIISKLSLTYKKKSDMPYPLEVALIVNLFV